MSSPSARFIFDRSMAMSSASSPTFLDDRSSLMRPAKALISEMLPLLGDPLDNSRRDAPGRAAGCIRQRPGRQTALGGGGDVEPGQRGGHPGAIQEPTPHRLSRRHPHVAEHDLGYQKRAVHPSQYRDVVRLRPGPIAAIQPFGGAPAPRRGLSPRP